MAPKVHAVAVAPEPTAAAPTLPTTTDEGQPEPPTVVLTVWRKSLLFNCDGFTVYDARGDLAFRVDCYGPRRRRRRAEVVLMDATGTPLLAVRRKRLISLAERWVIHDDSADGTSRSPPPPPAPLLSVRRHAGGKTLAHVTPLASASAGSDAGAAAPLVVEGSYGRRACAVRDARGDVVAEVQRKEAVGDDVFRLVVSPRLGAPLAMGIVIALDEMFGGSPRPSLLRRAG